MEKRGFYETVLLQVRERIGLAEAKILSGNLSHDDYKAFSGRLSGLLEAEHIVKKIYSDIFFGKSGEENE